MRSLSVTCFMMKHSTVRSMRNQNGGPPLGLRRIINIEENPNVCVVIDHYEENWGKLGFVMVHGKAELLRSGEEYQEAINELRKKYSQYRSMNLHTRPIIKILPRRISAWRAIPNSFK